MKTTVEEIKKMVKEELRRSSRSKLVERRDPMTQMLRDLADTLSDMIEEQLDENGPSWSRDFIDNNPVEDLPVPARLEDIDGFAETVAKRVAMLLEPKIATLVEGILTDMMGP